MVLMISADERVARNAGLLGGDMPRGVASRDLYTGPSKTATWSGREGNSVYSRASPTRKSFESPWQCFLSFLVRLVAFSLSLCLVSWVLMWSLLLRPDWWRFLPSVLFALWVWRSFASKSIWAASCSVLTSSERGFQIEKMIFFFTMSSHVCAAYSICCSGNSCKPCIHCEQSNN